MPTIIDPQLAEVSALCRRYGVRKLELFGSATTGAFDRQTSDLDFLIDFDPDRNDRPTRPNRSGGGRQRIRPKRCGVFRHNRTQGRWVHDGCSDRRFRPREVTANDEGVLRGWRRGDSRFSRSDVQHGGKPCTCAGDADADPGQRRIDRLCHRARHDRQGFRQQSAAGHCRRESGICSDHHRRLTTIAG